MVSRLDETAVEVRLLQQRVGRMEDDRGLESKRDTEPVVTLAAFESWTADHEERARAFNDQIEKHEAKLDEMNAEHAQRIELLQRGIVEAIASTTAVADTLKQEHSELSRRIDWNDSQYVELKGSVAEHVEALGVSIKMHGVKSGDEARSPRRSRSSAH